MLSSLLLLGYWWPYWHKNKIHWFSAGQTVQSDYAGWWGCTGHVLQNLDFILLLKQVYNLHLKRTSHNKNKFLFLKIYPEINVLCSILGIFYISRIVIEALWKFCALPICTPAITRHTFQKFSLAAPFSFSYAKYLY